MSDLFDDAVLPLPHYPIGAVVGVIVVTCAAAGYGVARTVWHFATTRTL